MRDRAQRLAVELYHSRFIVKRQVPDRSDFTKAGSIYQNLYVGLARRQLVFQRLPLGCIRQIDGETPRRDRQRPFQLLHPVHPAGNQPDFLKSRKAIRQLSGCLAPHAGRGTCNYRNFHEKFLPSQVCTLGVVPSFRAYIRFISSCARSGWFFSFRFRCSFHLQRRQIPPHFVHFHLRRSVCARSYRPQPVFWRLLHDWQQPVLPSGCHDAPLYIRQPRNRVL